jgi:ABC-type multidrug transport system fused ATPase/permease subunit
MLLLLNWRLWLVAGLVALLAFTHIHAYRKGKANVRAEWSLSIAAANEQARETERLRQKAVDAASAAAVLREAGLRADADRARSASRGLRDQLASLPSCGDPGTAPAVAAVATRELLGECAEEVGRLARAADGHASDVRLLLDAWPR